MSPIKKMFSNGEFVKLYNVNILLYMKHLVKMNKLQVQVRSAF